MEVDEAPRAWPDREAPWKRGRHDLDARRVADAQTDPARFVALYDLYIDRIHDYVRLRVANPTVAEDVTSHVFMTALAHIGAFKVQEGGSFAAWLFRIAHNAVQDIYRQRPVRHDVDDLLGGVSDPEPGPETQALREDRAAVLRRTVALLKQEQQHLIALRYGAGLSTDEIARATGKSAGSVRVSLHRALRALRRRYPDDER